MQALSLPSFITLYRDDISVIDTRDTDTFKSGFIPGSIVLPAAQLTKEWMPHFPALRQPVIIITDNDTEAATWLAAAGIQNIQGFLDGGYATWVSAGEPIDMIIDVEADELMMDIPFDDRLMTVDVRKPVEFAEGHLKNAINLPLDEMGDPMRIASFDESDNIYLYCSNGVRSMVAASVLKKHGVHNLRHVTGGWEAIKSQPKVQIVKEPGILN